MKTEIDKAVKSYFDKFSNINKDKKILILFALSAILIFFIAISEFDNKNTEETVDNTTVYDNFYMEKKELEEFLENIEGAGKVKIMITYDSTKEYIYAKNQSENSKDENDNDKEINYKSEHIIVKEDGKEKGLIIKEIYPEIRGIAVVCDGGNNPVIKEQIVYVLSALFGINTNRISVAAKSS